MKESDDEIDNQFYFSEVNLVLSGILCFFPNFDTH